MTFIHDLLSLMDEHTKRRSFILLFLIAIGSVLESISIALFIPIIMIVVEPERSSSIPGLSDLFDSFGLMDSESHLFFGHNSTRCPC